MGRAVMQAIGAFTEGMDAVGAFWDALPAWAKTRIPGERTTPATKAADIARFLASGRDDAAYWTEAAKNFAAEQAEDAFYGSIGQAQRAANRNNPFNRNGRGSTTGPWDDAARRQAQEAARDGRPPRDRWSRFGGYNPRG